MVPTGSAANRSNNPTGVRLVVGVRLLRPLTQRGGEHPQVPPSTEVLRDLAKPGALPCSRVERNPLCAMHSAQGWSPTLIPRVVRWVKETTRANAKGVDFPSPIWCEGPRDLPSVPSVGAHGEVSAGSLEVYIFPSITSIAKRVHYSYIPLRVPFCHVCART